MNKKNKIILVVSILIFIFISISAYYSLNKKDPASEDLDTIVRRIAVDESNSFWPRSVKPGETSIENLISTYGDPIDNNGKNFTFDTKGESLRIYATIEDERLVLLKELITTRDRRKLSQVFIEFGDPTLTLYGEESTEGIILYAYPRVGLAVLANPNQGGVVFEVWSFQPTDLNNFRSRWAPEYKDSPSEVVSF